MTSAFVISLRTDGFLVQIAISFCLWPFSTYSCVLSTQARSTRKMRPKEQPFKDDDWEVVHKYPTLLTSQWGQLLMHSLLAIGSLLSPTQVCTALSFSLSLTLPSSLWYILRSAPKWTFTQIFVSGPTSQGTKLKTAVLCFFLSKKTEVTNDLCFVAGKLD